MAEASTGKLDVQWAGGMSLLLSVNNDNVHVDPLYVSESGSDESGRGTKDQPFKTILQVSRSQRCMWREVTLSLGGHCQAMRLVGKEPFPMIFVDSKTEGEVCWTIGCWFGVFIIWILLSVAIAMDRGISESDKKDEKAVCSWTTESDQESESSSELVVSEICKTERGNSNNFSIPSLFSKCTDMIVKHSA